MSERFVDLMVKGFEVDDHEILVGFLGLLAANHPNIDEIERLIREAEGSRP